jgi:hypothetical protein
LFQRAPEQLGRLGAGDGETSADDHERNSGDTELTSA